MPLTKNLNSYKDVEQVLNIARTREIRYRLSTPGKAMHFRQRAYYYRKLLYVQASEANIIPGASVSTPYDDLTMTLENCDVVIKKITLIGQVLDLITEDVVKQIEVGEDDNLAELAEAFKKQLEGSDDNT